MFFLVCLYLFPINNGFLFSDCGSYMLCAKSWGSQQPQPLLALRRGFYPIPRPFPSPGEGMQPPYSGSVIELHSIVGCASAN